MAITLELTDREALDLLEAVAWAKDAADNPQAEANFHKISQLIKIKLTEEHNADTTRKTRSS